MDLDKNDPLIKLGKGAVLLGIQIKKLGKVSFAEEYIRAQEVEDVTVAEGNLIVEGENNFSVITLPKKKEMIIKVIDNLKNK